VDDIEEAQNDTRSPSDDAQSKTDEYVFVEENGNSQFKRLSQTSDDDVIFGLDDSHHSDQEMRQWSPLASVHEIDDLAHELDDSKNSEADLRQCSSVDSSHHSFHIEPFGDESKEIMMNRPPSTDSSCTKTDGDEPPHVDLVDAIQEESRCLIENLTSPTLSLTINGHHPMSASRQIIDTSTPPKEVIYVDIRTVLHELSCVSKNIETARSTMLVILFGISGVSRFTFP
jgi:hypothetical protein